MHDRQIVLLGGAPDRFEIGVIDRPVVVEQGLHRDRPFRIAPFADFARRLADVARRGDDRAFEPVGERPAKLVHEAVVGADQPDFERHVGEARPRLSRKCTSDPSTSMSRTRLSDRSSTTPRARPPLAAPCAAVSRSGTRLGLAQGALVGLVGKAVGVADAAVDAARFDGTAIRRQIIEARAKARVDVFLQHIGTRVDMRVGVIDTEAFLHSLPP